jgi:C6 transcription factor Pro1
MNGSLRSKSGCWTCRLRKKKCDERQPQCDTCESLSIPCHGYGPKPSWLDNGDLERAAMNNLRAATKRSSRRKVTVQPGSRRHRAIKLVPKPAGGSVEGAILDLLPNENAISTGGLETSSAGARSAGSTRDDLDATAVAEKVQECSDCDIRTSSQLHGDASVQLASSLTAEHSLSLMLFLDNVFPLQYPIHQWTIKHGGRGWLLSRILQTKPLYHAALAFSAYHRRLIQVADLGPSCKTAALAHEEEHLDACIKSMHHFVQCSAGNFGTGLNLGILTSAVQLFFLEVV